MSKRSKRVDSQATTSSKYLNARRRHANYYNSVLDQANRLYIDGGDAINQGLALFDLEWPNIEAAQAWANSQIKDDMAAELCSNYAVAGANVLSMRQHPRVRIRWLKAALTASHRLKNPLSEGMHLGNLGNVYAALSKTRQAIKLYERQLALVRSIDDRRGEGNALANLGNAYADLGEARRAIEFYEQALVIVSEIGNQRAGSTILGNLGVVYTEQGDLSRAVKYFQEAL